MSLKCKKCGASFNLRSELHISNESSGYRCKKCLTMHSWTTGWPVAISKPNLAGRGLGSTIGKGGERK